MLKILLTVLIPLLTPTLVWLAWMAIDRRNGSAGGQAANGQVANGQSAGARPIPWVKLSISGAVLAAATLAVLVGVDGHRPDEVYVPAHIDKDGRFVPGQTAPATPPERR